MFYSVDFIYNPSQLEEINSIVVGMVQVQFNNKNTFVPAFGVFKQTCLFISFKLQNKVRTIYIHRPEVISFSSLIKTKTQDLILAKCSFIVDSKFGINNENVTAFLFPDCPSKLYSIKDAQSIYKESLIPTGIFGFDINDLGLNCVEFLAIETFEILKTNLNNCLNFNIKKYGAYALKMLQLGSSYNWALEDKCDEEADNCVWEANYVKEQFSNYLSNLEDTETKVPIIKVVEQDILSLPPCLEDNIIKTTIVEIPDEAYIYYDADFGYFENEARQRVKTDDQVKTEETVVNTINTNNTEVKTMTNAPRSKAILNAIAAHEAQQAELNNNTNTEVKTMTAPKYDRSAAPMTQDELNEAMMAEDNTVAAANGQEKSEEIATAEFTNTNSILNNKTMDNTKTSSRKLVSIELVVNIIAAIGGDCARKSHSVAKRTEKLNVLRNKNSKTISNVRGYGAIRTNSNDGSTFLDVNVFPETAMTVYNTNNRPVIIFHYDDNTQAIQSEANTEKFWRKVFHTSEETVIPNINPTLKVDLPANADVLCERIDAGTIQAVSIKFTNMDKKMFTYYSSDVSGRFIVYLKAAGDYDVSLLRDTVEVSDNFLNYNGEKGAVNNFAGASKTGRSGNNVAVVARPQVAAAQSNLYGMPSTAEVSKVVETVAPVAVVIDTEKETLRAENVALKAEVSELKTQIADLTAGQSRMEAMLAQLVAAQAVKTEEGSIPEIIEIVAPALPVEVVETEAQQLARLEQERMSFFRACEFDNFEATGEETLDSDQHAELNKLDEEIKTLKWLMDIPVADRAAAIEARHLEKEEAIRKSSEALANINKPDADLSGLFA